MQGRGTATGQRQTRDAGCLSKLVAHWPWEARAAPGGEGLSWGRQQGRSVPTSLAARCTQRTCRCQLGCCSSSRRHMKPVRRQRCRAGVGRGAGAAVCQCFARNIMFCSSQYACAPSHQQAAPARRCLCTETPVFHPQRQRCQRKVRQQRQRAQHVDEEQGQAAAACGNSGKGRWGPLAEWTEEKPQEAQKSCPAATPALPPGLQLAWHWHVRWLAEQGTPPTDSRSRSWRKPSGRDDGGACTTVRGKAGAGPGAGGC